MVTLKCAIGEISESGFSVQDVIYYYEKWVHEKFWVLISGFNELENRYEYAVFRSPKRGDEKYARKVMFKFSKLGSMVKNEGFFNVRDRKRVSTRMLLVTLTYDPSRKDVVNTWHDVGIDFNRWITNKRRLFGKIDVVRTWESHESGVCHVHALLLFREYEFKGCWADRHRQWRVSSADRDRVKAHWGHGFSDVQAVSSVRGGFYYVGRYLNKAADVQKTGSKGLKTLALCWFFRKRSFSISGAFRSVYHDLIKSLRNSKFRREFIVCLDGVKRVVGVVDWHLMGFIKGDFPDWDENFQELGFSDVVDLERGDQIRYV